MFSHGAPSHIAPPPSARHAGQPAPLAGTVLATAPGYMPDDLTRVLRRAQADAEKTALIPVVPPDMASHVYPLLDPIFATPTRGRPSAGPDLAGMASRVAAPLRRLHSGADGEWFAPIPGSSTTTTTLRDFHTGLPSPTLTPPTGASPITLSYTLVGDSDFHTKKAAQ